MALPIPNLDDRDFAALMDGAKRLIPLYCQEWTNFNPADPGITILELLAWLTETVLFRINQIPESNYRRFLELLGAPPADGEELTIGIRRAVAALYESERAITANDIVTLAKQCLTRDFPQLERQTRVICYQDRSSGWTAAEGFLPGVTVIILTGSGVTPPDNLYATVGQFLAERQLIGSRIRVVGPRKLPVRIKAWITVTTGSDSKQAANRVQTQIENYYDPITGGPEGRGWPPGRGLYRSELFRLLERISGVDHGLELELTPARKRVDPDQLVVPQEVKIFVENG